MRREEGEVLKNLNYILNQADKVTDKVLDRFENGTSEFDIHDGVIIGLFEDTLAKIKSAKVLIDAENFDSINVILRSAFEGYVYLTFILDKETERRAKAYAYKNNLGEIQLFNTITDTGRVGREIRSFLNVSIEEVRLENPNYNDENRIRQEREYRQQYGSNETTIRKYWYDFDGKTRSFEQLCQKMKLEVYYNLIYRVFSKDAHSNRALARINLSSDILTIGNLNKDSRMHQSLSGLLIIDMIRDIYSYYSLSKELKLFNMNIRLNYTK